MSIPDVATLEQMLSEPTPGLVEFFSRLPGDIIILGAGGKMGPTLAQMAKNASDAAKTSRRVIAVSRFSSPQEIDKLESAGVETIRCDLLDEEQLGALPDVPNVVFMAGMKFGTTGQESITWAMNAYLPGMVCRKYARSRIAAFSTGNVYGLTPVTLGGSVETDIPNPEGEYAMSALGRERVFEHFSRTAGTKVSIIRLNYAVEMRYGVLVDIARKVWTGEPVDVAMGCVNVIWQADANAMALHSLEHVSSPPFIVNVAGPEMISVRRAAEQFGRMMDKEPMLSGCESSDALLSNGQLGHKLFGYPRVSTQELMEWISDWVMRGGDNLGKPTHFEARDGKF